MSAFVWQAAESRRSAYTRKKEEREAKAQDAERLAETLGQGIEAPPFDPVGTTREERLDIPEGCTGILIGKKGENLKSVEHRCKVTAKIEKTDSGSVVVVKGSPAHVAAAVRELDFVADCVEVPAHMTRWACGSGARHLRLIRDLTGAAVVSLRRDREDGKADQGNAAAVATEQAEQQEEDELGADAELDNNNAAEPDKEELDNAVDDACGWIDLKGLRQSVKDARLCLETHLSYYPAFVEMGEVEADLDRQIAAAQAKLGRRPGVSRQRREEDGADRSASPTPGRRGRGGASGRGGDRGGEPSAATGNGYSGGRGGGQGRGGASNGETSSNGRSRGGGSRGAGGRGAGGRAGGYSPAGQVSDPSSRKGGRPTSGK